MWFEDMAPGDEFVTEEAEVTKQDILAFAHDFDPQPFHLRQPDEDGGFRDVIASGFFTLSLAWGLWVRSGIPADHGEGGVGMEACRWSEPVYPGDRIHAKVRVGEQRITSKRRGLQRLDFIVKNHHGKEVMQFSTYGLVRQRSTQPMA